MITNGRILRHAKFHWFFTDSKDLREWPTKLSSSSSSSEWLHMVLYFCVYIYIQVWEKKWAYATQPEAMEHSIQMAKPNDFQLRGQTSSTYSDVVI